MPRITSNLIALLFCASLAAGCGSSDNVVTARLSLEVPNENAQQTTGVLFDEAGLFDLTRYPVFVFVEVTAADMETTTAYWPEDSSQLSPGATVVELLLELTPGTDRKVDARVYLRDQGETFLFGPETVETITLSPGDTQDLPLNVMQLDDGSISGTAPEGSVEVWLVDETLNVLADRATVSQGLYEFPRVPVDTRYVLYWMDDADTVTPIPDVEVVLTELNEEKTVDLGETL